VLEIEGALWTQAMIRAARDGPPPPEVFDRVVIAVDPTASVGGAACGIIAAGRSGDRAWILEDRTVSGVGPHGWARRAMRAAERHGAAAVVAEINQGGDMVQALLATLGATPVRQVRAT